MLLGLLTATILQPGSHLSLPLPASDASLGLKTGAFTLKDFVVHLVPKSIAEAMANNEILQIVVFSIFFGTALSALGESGKRLTGVIDDLAQVMLKVTGAVMWFAPVAVFAALASTITTQGRHPAHVREVHGELLSGTGAAVGRADARRRDVPRQACVHADPADPRAVPAVVRDGDRAAYPKLLDALDRFGVNRKISSFVLPIGYSFNLDGSMMYCTFAVLFIAQVYGIHLPLGTQITMLLMLMVTSKGMAGVPRASLVVIAATLNQFNLPEAGLLLIMGVDMFLDMGRSATNAVGNSIAAAVVAKWEGQLDDPRDDNDPGNGRAMQVKAPETSASA